MTIKEEIIIMLRNGLSVKDIREKFSSKSQLYEALTEFLLKLSDEVGETRAALKQEELDLQETRSEHEQLKMEKSELQNDVEALWKEKEELKNAVKSLRREEDDLQNVLTETRARGYTPGVVAKLKSASDRDGAEVGALLETLEKAHVLRKEVDRLEAEKTGLANEIDTLENKKQQLLQMVTSLGNELDEAKRTTATFREAADTMARFFKMGYNVEDLKKIISGLKAIGIRRESGLSISRLVEGVLAAKTIQQLQDEIDSAQKQIAGLIRTKKDVKASLRMIRQVTVKEIETATASSREAIAETGKQTDTALAMVVDDFRANLTALATQTSSIVAENLKEAQRLHVLNEEDRRMLSAARVLIGNRGSKEDLEAVSAELVINVLEKIRLWLTLKVPTSSAPVRFYTACSMVIQVKRILWDVLRARDG